MSYFMRKVFSAAGGGAGNDGGAAQGSADQQQGPLLGAGNAQNSNTINTNQNGYSSSPAAMMLSSPSSSQPNNNGGGGGFGSIRNFMGSNLVPQGIQTAVQSRKIAGQVSTLLLRIQTSALGRDRRDAISDLCDISPADVAEHIRTEDLGMLLMVGDMNRSDNQLLTRIFELIASITDSENSAIGDHLREPLLHYLLEQHVSVFLEALALPRSTAAASSGGADSGDAASGDEDDNEESKLASLRAQTFWVRYHSIKILQRLQEYDSLALQKQLLSSNSLGAIIDILQDDTNDGALRSEGMILLEHITLTDMELQTILAFDSCFERLLSIVHAEGGVNGEVTSVDSLRIIYNMLRNNKATQKFFREMGLAAQLKPLLVDVTSTVASHASPTAVVAATAGGHLTPKGVEVVLSAIDILQCLLRFGDANSEGVAVRDAIVSAGLIEPLCRVAFSSRLDDRTNIAALRTIALQTVSHKQTGEQLMHAKVNLAGNWGSSSSSSGGGGGSGLATSSHSMMDGGSNPLSPPTFRNLPALWACLHTALYHFDGTHQSSALQIIGAAMATAGTGAQIASYLVKGLAPIGGGGGGMALPASFASVQAAVNYTQQQQMNGGGSRGGNTSARAGGGGGGVEYPHLTCGLLLSSCLMTSAHSSSNASNNSRYYAAWVLNQALLVPQITEQMLLLPWGTINSSSVATASAAPTPSPTPRGGVGSPPPPPQQQQLQQQTFFMAYLRQLEETIRTRQCNLATVAMMIRPLFTWFAFCGKAIYLFLGWNGAMGGVRSPNSPTPTTAAAAAAAINNNSNTNTSNVQGLNAFNFFLEWSLNPRDPMHVRFMAAMVCVAAIVACPANDLPPSIAAYTNKEDLRRRFCSAVRLGMLEEFLYNISASSDWSDPPQNLLLVRAGGGGGGGGSSGSSAGTPLILYDRDYVAILNELSITAKKWLSSVPVVNTAAAGGATASNNNGLGGGGANNNAPAAPNSSNGLQQQQQLQQYENIIRQLQSELKTRDHTIADLTQQNEKLVFANEDLMQKESEVRRLLEEERRRNGGAPPSTTPAPATKNAILDSNNNNANNANNAAMTAAMHQKDDEIKALKTTLSMLEERLRKQAEQQQQQQATNNNNTSSVSFSAPNTARSQNLNYSINTGRSVVTMDGDQLAACVEDAYAKLRILESERDELLILVAELDEENEVLKAEGAGGGVDKTSAVPSAINSTAATPRPILKGGGGGGGASSDYFASLYTNNHINTNGTAAAATTTSNATELATANVNVMQATPSLTTSAPTTTMVASSAMQPQLLANPFCVPAVAGGAATTTATTSLVPSSPLVPSPPSTNDDPFGELATASSSAPPPPSQQQQHQQQQGLNPFANPPLPLPPSSSQQQQQQQQPPPPLFFAPPPPVKAAMGGGGGLPPPLPPAGFSIRPPIHQAPTSAAGGGAFHFQQQQQHHTAMTAPPPPFTHTASATVGGAMATPRGGQQQQQQQQPKTVSFARGEESPDLR